MGFICQSCSIEQQSWSGTCPNCGSKRALQIGAEDTMIGRTVAGKYKILRKLGQGGVGAVFEGELEGIGQRVALKFLNKSFQMDGKTALRFLNEAKGLARLSHPNTVSLHDFGQDEEGHFFISMEFVEGVDLRKYLEEHGRLPPPDAIEVTLQAADALGDAHGKGLVHRDVKPENIMVRRRARGLFIKVLDFGLARLVEEGTSRLTNAGTLMGSLRYISPEQASGKEVDGRTDIYSLGIVLFEMLTGTQPFIAAIEVDLLRMHKETPMPHLWEAAGDLALPQLDAVIQRATEKDPNARYASMEEFVLALNATLASLPSAPDLKALSTDRPAATMKLPAATDSQLQISRSRAGRSSSQLPPQPMSSSRVASRNSQADGYGSVPEQMPELRSPGRSTWLMVGGGVTVLALAALLYFALRPRPAPASPPIAAPSAQVAPPVQPSVAQPPPPAQAAEAQPSEAPQPPPPPVPAPTPQRTAPSTAQSSPKPFKKKPTSGNTARSDGSTKKAAPTTPIVDPFAQ
jgi:serine/threonine protein kinase